MQAHKPKEMGVLSKHGPQAEERVGTPGDVLNATEEILGSKPMTHVGSVVTLFVKS